MAGPLTTLFCDMNAFFASAEQQRRPELRGKPVAVVAVDVESTCCIAASYEAKRLGVKTGTPVWQAKRICPAIRIIEADPHHYMVLHHAVRDAVGGCLPVHEVLSVDEVSCRLVGDEREQPNAVRLARQVKAAVRGVGDYLRCSVGLAPNRVLAKVAADMQKPNGLTVIDAADLPQRLYGLKLDDFPGVGRNMLRRLRAAGIATTEQFCAASELRLRDVWGSVVGRYWWHWLRGVDVEQPTSRHKRTLGHSHVLPPELRTEDGARAVLIRLIDKSAARMRRAGYWARWMSVYISYSHREEGWRATVPLGWCRDTLTMVQALGDLWPHRPRGQPRPTQVAVTLLGLVADAHAPPPLFPAERDRARLADVVDEINARVQLEKSPAIYFGGEHDVLDAAPTRIAFNQQPDPAADFDGRPEPSRRLRRVARLVDALTVRAPDAPR